MKTIIMALTFVVCGVSLQADNAVFYGWGSCDEDALFDYNGIFIQPEDARSEEPLAGGAVVETDWFPETLEELFDARVGQVLLGHHEIYDLFYRSFDSEVGELVVLGDLVLVLEAFNDRLYYEDEEVDFETLEALKQVLLFLIWDCSEIYTEAVDPLSYVKFILEMDVLLAAIPEDLLEQDNEWKLIYQKFPSVEGFLYTQE